MPDTINLVTGDVEYRGLSYVVKSAAPTTADSAYAVPSGWLNTDGNEWWVLTNNDSGVGTWTNATGISGPGSATDNAVARFSGTGGATLQNSGVIIDDSDNVTGIASISGLSTDLAVAEGGTGASSLTDNAVLVGSGTSAITALTVGSNGQLLVGSTSADPVFATISSSDGSISFTTGAGSLSIQGTAASDTQAGVIELATDAETNTGTATDRATTPANITAWTGSTNVTTLGTIATGTWEGTTVAVDQGGTGATSLTDGGILLGSGTGAITATAVLSDGEMLVGDGTTDPAIESGATLRTSIGVGTGDSPEFSDVDLGTGGALRTKTSASNTALLQAYDVDGVSYTTFLTLTANNTPTCDLSTSVTMGGNAIYYAGGGDVAVADGGTGASSLTDGGVLLGSGTSAITALGQATNGQLVIGSTGADPVLAALSGTSNQVSVSNGAGSITLSTPQDIGTSSNVTFGNVTGTTIQAKTKIETDGDNDADIGDSTNAFKDIYMQGDLYYDNDNSYTQKHYNWTPLSKATASSSATLEFTLTAGWDFFMFVCDKIIPATDAASFQMQMSDDGGSTYETSNGRALLQVSPAGGLRASTATSTSAFLLADDIGNNDALHGVTGEMRLYNPNDATNYCRAMYEFFHIDENAINEFTYTSGGGQVRVSGDIDYVKFLMSSGNIASGTITMYGKNNI